jgi:hypothetical protein
MRKASLLSIVFGLFLVGGVQAQYCNPAVVSLIVYDEKGVELTESELNTLAAILPKQIGDADVRASETRLAPDNKSFYWWDSKEWASGRKVPALSFSNYGPCEMKLGEATLERNGQKMRLIFNITITRETGDRRPVIRAPKFQTGTFQLDLSDWSHDRHAIIPAERWKIVKG